MTCLDDKWGERYAESYKLCIISYSLFVLGYNSCNNRVKTCGLKIGIVIFMKILLRKPPLCKLGSHL